VKNHRTLSITVLTIVSVAALLGFGITLGFSAQGALARIVIDVGVLAAVAFVLTMMPKKEPLRCDDIADAMREIARGRYHKRLNDMEFGELKPIAQAFNELAGTLADSQKSAEDALRYQVPIRSELLGRGIVNTAHSIHPELGPVQTLEAFEAKELGAPNNRDLLQTVVSASARADLSSNELYEKNGSEIIADSADSISTTAHSQDNANTDVDASSDADSDSDAFEADSIPTDSAATARDIMLTFEQLMPDLYKQFEQAHEVYQRRPISFAAFESTVSQAREELIRAHQCRDVRFEVVFESGEVALRPKLIR
jgi:hypothetical protein